MASGVLNKTGTLFSNPAEFDRNRRVETVKTFLQNPSPTVLPQSEAGTPIIALPGHMVAGSPFPHSAQTRLFAWNSVTANNIPNPLGTVYSAPKTRMTQV